MSSRSIESEEGGDWRDDSTVRAGIALTEDLPGFGGFTTFLLWGI